MSVKTNNILQILKYNKQTGVLFRTISDIISEKKSEAYIIGGYVRDIILKRKSADIDIVVTGSGIELAEAVAKKLHIKTVTVYKNFGTAQFRYKNFDVEFVGARKESYRRNSRKPVVENGTLEDDQNRRDFTINALAISLNSHNFGELNDPFNGLGDIENCIIRTPLDPSVTFSDDPLRMLRAVRFASQLNFKIFPETFDSIIKQKKRIGIISKERISEELNKIIMSEKPSMGFNLLDISGVLELIFPELSEMKGVEVIQGKAHKDNFSHSLQVLDNIALKTNNLWLRWAALLHDIGKPLTKKYDENMGWSFHGHEYTGSKMIPEIFKKMHMPLNEKMKYVQKIVLLHLRPISLVSDEVSDSAVRRLLFEAGDDIDDLMLLAEADVTSKNEEKIKLYKKNFIIVRKKLKEVEEKDKLRNWQAPISGEEIMKIFNIQPSRMVGDIKNAIREAILDGEISNNYEAACRFMIENFKAKTSL